MKDFDGPLPLDLCREYDAAAEWCARRGATYSDLPARRFRDALPYIGADTDAFRRRVKDFAYAAAMEKTSVTAVREPPARGPAATCAFALFKNHDPNRAYPCGKKAIYVDALFPVYWDGNRCSEHAEWEQPNIFEI